MESESRQAHWQNVYTKKGENEVSWFQESPSLSLELIERVGATHASTVIDVGGGVSRGAPSDVRWNLQRPRRLCAESLC